MTLGSNLDTLDLLRSSATVPSPGEGEASAGWGKGSVIPNLALTASERAVTSKKKWFPNVLGYTLVVLEVL